MVAAFQKGLGDGRNGYSPSYGLPSLRKAISENETSKGWECSPDDVYVCHGVTEALQIIFAATLQEGDKVLAPGPLTRHIWHIHRCMGLLRLNMD